MLHAAVSIFIYFLCDIHFFRKSVFSLSIEMYQKGSFFDERFGIFFHPYMHKYLDDVPKTNRFVC